MSSQLHRIRFDREPANAEDTTVVVYPAVTGTTTQGQTLTCSAPTVRGLTPTITYQWYRGGTLISGATAATRVLAAGDVGHRMSCAVSVANARVPTKVVVTRPTAVVT
jgi:hypothetical protein